MNETDDSASHIEIVYDYTRPSFLFDEYTLKCSLGTSTTASSEDLLSDCSSEEKAATQLLSRDLDTGTIEVLSNILHQQLRFMRYQVEQFAPLISMGCFKQYWKQGDFIYRTGINSQLSKISITNHVPWKKNEKQGRTIFCMPKTIVRPK